MPPFSSVADAAAAGAAGAAGAADGAGASASGTPGRARHSLVLVNRLAGERRRTSTGRADEQEGNAQFDSNRRATRTRNTAHFAARDADENTVQFTARDADETTAQCAARDAGGSAAARTARVPGGAREVVRLGVRDELDEALLERVAERDLVGVRLLELDADLLRRPREGGEGGGLTVTPSGEDPRRAAVLTRRTAVVSRFRKRGEREKKVEEKEGRALFFIISLSFSRNKDEGRLGRRKKKGKKKGEKIK